MNYKSFHKIAFPAYRLPNDNLYSQDGLLYIDNEILDDKNQPGKTLGMRRLQTYMDNLFEFRYAMLNIRDLILNSSGDYIDSKGRYFYYEKTKFCALRYYKIDSHFFREKVCFLKLKQLKHVFEVPRPPRPAFCWAGILLFNKAPWLLYDYSRIKHKDSRKKI